MKEKNELKVRFYHSHFVHQSSLFDYLQINVCIYRRLKTRLFFILYYTSLVEEFCLRWMECDYTTIYILTSSLTSWR
jgi:hypothetical protein